MKFIYLQKELVMNKEKAKKYWSEYFSKVKKEVYHDNKHNMAILQRMAKQYIEVKTICPYCGEQANFINTYNFLESNPSLEFICCSCKKIKSCMYYDLRKAIDIIIYDIEKETGKIYLQDKEELFKKLLWF